MGEKEQLICLETCKYIYEKKTYNYILIRDNYEYNQCDAVNTLKHFLIGQLVEFFFLSKNFLSKIYQKMLQFHQLNTSKRLYMEKIFF